MIAKLMSVSLIPVIALNIFGHIVGVIWLFILGEWRIVLLGWLIDIVFTFAYSIIMIVQLPLAALISHLENQRRHMPLVGFVGFLNMIIVHGINLLWVILVTFTLLNISEGQNGIPYLLFGWGIAVGPFQYMASKEPPDSIGSFAAVYLVAISYILLASFSLFGILIFSLLPIIVITLAMEIYLIRTTMASMAERKLDLPQQRDDAPSIEDESDDDIDVENIDVLLVDDHKVVRDGLRNMLLKETGITIVGEAADGLEALEKMELLLPDMVITNIKMPKMDGLTLTRRIKETDPLCKVIIFTLQDQFVEEAREFGADAYLLKDINSSELISAIIKVAKGQKLNKSTRSLL